MKKGHPILRLLRGVWAGMALAVPAGVVAQTTPDYDLPPVNYSKAKDNNTITRIQAALDEQKLTFPDSGAKEVLKALLDELKIPVSSQVIAFSKTSLQREMITPANPRAMYFNEDFYVGYVPGGLIEVIACDDPAGMMFYSFDPHEKPKERKFVRSQECMTCHANHNTMDIPGLLVRSVYTEKTGETVLSWGSFLTTPASPMSERWGGWYVTGTHGQSLHMGNKFVLRSESGRLSYQKKHGQNVTDLSQYYETGKHLTDTSDILALMLMEHQVQVHNTFFAAKMGYERRVHLGKAINNGKYDLKSESAKKMIHGYADKVLKVLLFADSIQLPTDGIDGDDTFEKDFTKRGMRFDDHSLRDLRLQKRIFKYRCSYMIRSKSFGLLPEPIRREVLERLYKLVTDQAMYPGLPSLSSREKKRIHAILSHTHDEYKKVSGGNDQ